MFLAFQEMKRAKVRFGLLTGAVGLLVFLIMFQQTLLTGLVNQFIGAIKNQSGEVLVYNGQARKNLEGSIILAEQQDAIAAVDGVSDAAPLGEATFTVTANSQSGNAFAINRVAAGGYTRTCTTAGDGGCKAGGTW